MEHKVSDGITIHYDLERRGKTVLVFIHGAGGDAAAWKDIRSHLKGVSTLAIDLRGHGLSERPRGMQYYTLERFARDVYEILIHERIDDFVLIGHCFGGMVTLQFHALYPHLAKSYILIDTTYRVPSSLKFIFNIPFAQQLISLIPYSAQKTSRDFSQYRNTGDYDPKRIYSDAKATTLKSWLSTYCMLKSYDATTTLPTIQQPVLVLHGKQDTVFDIKNAHFIANNIPNSTLHVMEGNHIIVLNDPKGVVDQILAFIKRKKLILLS